MLGMHTLHTMKAYRHQGAIEAFHFKDEAAASSEEFAAWKLQMGLRCVLEDGMLWVDSTGPVIARFPTWARAGNWLVVENNHLRVYTAELFAKHFTIYDCDVRRAIMEDPIKDREMPGPDIVQFVGEKGAPTQATQKLMDKMLATASGSPCSGAVKEMRSLRDDPQASPEVKRLLNLTIWAAIHRRFPSTEAFKDPHFNPDA